MNETLCMQLIISGINDRLSIEEEGQFEGIEKQEVDLKSLIKF